MNAVQGVSDDIPIGREVPTPPPIVLCPICRSGEHHCADPFCSCICVDGCEDA